MALRWRQLAITVIVIGIEYSAENTENAYENISNNSRLCKRQHVVAILWSAGAIYARIINWYYFFNHGRPTNAFIIQATEQVR